VTALPRALALALLVVGGAATSSRTARAVEREHHLGLDAGGTMLVVADRSGPEVGPALGAHYAYGLSDAFNLMVEGAFSLVGPGERASNASTPKTRPSSLARLGVGVGYVFDVLRWVPYAGILAGGFALTGGTIAGTKILPGLSAAGGLDYRFSRTWAAGVALRWHLLASDPSTYPTLMDVFARVEFTSGW
jgi:hypothetical protein